MIKIYLSKLLEDKDISQSKFKDMTGIRPGTISAYFHGFVKRINVKDLNIMCKTLNCKLSDLIDYIPDKKD